MAQSKSYETQFGHRFYNLLHKRFSLPWAYSVLIVRMTKILRRPLEYAKRKSAAHRVIKTSRFADSVSRTEGYWLFRPDELPGAKAVAAECARVFANLQTSGSIHELRNNKKKHLRALVKGDDFSAYPEIGKFIMSRPVMEAVTGYFRSAPILCSIALLWSVKNDTVISSQKYHVDGEDVSQLKLFINVWDVRDEHGPLTFYPASSTSIILQNAARTERLNVGDVAFDDSFVLPAANGRETFRLVGEAGTGVFVDTSRCLHFGSRGNTEERLMLMVQFAPFNFARESAIDLGSTEWIPLPQNGDLQRMALRR